MSQRFDAAIAAAKAKGPLLCDFIDAGMERECGRPAHAHVLVAGAEVLACAECLGDLLAERFGSGADDVQYTALTGRVD